MKVTAALRNPSLKKVWPWIWTAFPVLLLLDYQAIAPVGHWTLLWLQTPYLFGLLAALCAVAVLPVLLFRPKWRVLASAWLIASVVYLPLAIGGLLLGRQIRASGFERLAVRSAPLVSAIRNYTVADGQPPPTLEQLIPEYLPRVPRTGIMAYPTYRYYAGTNAARYDGNPWVLVVHTPSAGINFDQFMYFPLQNYPSTGYGGSLVRVRDWAYVHE